jgi:hypothetical protein
VRAQGTSRPAGIKNAKSLGPIRAVLAEVIAMYGKGRMGPFASDPVMRRHFTAQFISVWDRAIARSGTIIDADPFTGQGLNSVNLQGVDILAETPNSATVEMHLGGTGMDKDNTAFSGTQKMWMRREVANWKIDDTLTGGMKLGGLTSKGPSPNNAKQEGEGTHSTVKRCCGNSTV